MSHLASIRLVAARELRERMRGRALWAVVVLSAALVVALMLLPSVLGSSAPLQVGLVGGAAQELAAPLQQSAAEQGVSITLTEPTTAAAANAQVSAGSLDAALEAGASGLVLVTQSGPNASLPPVVAQAVGVQHLKTALGDDGLSAGAIAHAQQAPAVANRELSPAPPDEAGRAVAAIAVAYLLLYGLAGWGGSLAAGVAQEKTSRTAELLVAAVPPRDLLVGKVLGLGACGLLQIAVTIAAAAITNAVAHTADIPSTVWALVPTVALWFLLGYTLYAFAFAAAGSLVARQEEVQMVQIPMILPLVLAMLLSYSSSVAATTLWYRLLAVLPPLAPVLMPTEIAVGGMAWWQLPLSLILMLGAIAAVVSVAGRIYATSLLTSGARLHWMAALRQRS